MTARPTLTELLDDADFVGRHIGPTAEEQAEMLAVLGVATVDELRVACEAERVRDVAGLGAKAEEKILAAIAAGGGPRKIGRASCRERV